MSTERLLLALLKYELRAIAPRQEEMAALGSSEELERVCALAKKHEVISFAAHAIFDLGITLSGELTVRLQKHLMLAKHHYECINYEISEISRVLKEKGIEHIFLKGSTIRAYYPVPWLRTSCDIDVLVKEEKLSEAQAVLESELSYVSTGKTPHDIPMNAPSKVHVELHYNLLESDVVDGAEKVLLDVWNYAEPNENTSLYTLADEMYYYYHIVHMAKHFVHGGCGIRPFLDLWLLENKIAGDWQKRAELLAQGGMERFCETAREVASVWIGDAPSTERVQEVERYIMYGGVYGNTENRVAVQQLKKGGKFKYMISRIFPPLSLMQCMYPILEKHKWLLPFMYVRRFFRLTRKGRLTRSVAEFKYNENITKAGQKETEKFLDKIGL